MDQRTGSRAVILSTKFQKETLKMHGIENKNNKNHLYFAYWNYLNSKKRLPLEKF